MKKPLIIGLWVAAIVGLAIVSVGYFSGVSVDVLQPRGEVAAKQRDLIVFTLGLSLIIIIPVFFMLFYFAWKYREGSRTGLYAPDWNGSKWLEVIWWGVPCVIIGVLGVITWQSSHDLDPRRQLVSDARPVRVQVVALQWKWLFIYPDYSVATINDLRFPEKTPVNFEITADAPMNSFWIPSLGGQIYAMSGMSTKLALTADTTGIYKGSSTNISGEGYADMTFAAQSLSSSEFDTWIKQVASTGGILDEDRYAGLAQPATAKTPSYFVLKKAGLYSDIIMKYTMPDNDTNTYGVPTMKGMHE